MDVEQRARINVLYERVSALFAERGKESGEPTEPEQKLKRIKSLLNTGNGDAPLSLLEEKYVSVAAKVQAKRNLDRLVEKKLAKQEREYYDQMRLTLLSQMGGAENTATLKKLADLVVKEGIALSAPAFERARPQKSEELVGQRDAFQALLGALCSPYPQHVILYGPPGVGKTSAARLALEAARGRKGAPFLKSAPFIEVDGSTMRYDPHGGVNPLIGSVHDPIYQGAAKELAGQGLPEPKCGLVSEAHGGVLFIDEIGEMDAALQNMLLKVLEDKRVRFDSPYYDPENPAVPEYIRQLFNLGAPADFVLIAATTRSPEEITPALRSRCVEIFFSPLEEEDLYRIAVGAARRMEIEATPAALRLLAAASSDGRECVRLLLAAQGLGGRVGAQKARRALHLGGFIKDKRPADPKVGRIAMLGVLGRRGCVLRLEAVALPGGGNLRLNSAAGSMAQDAVRNAAVAVAGMGVDLNQLDIHMSIGGGGQVDGPSMGLAAALALLSAVWNKPLRQDVAVTGELSLRGEVLPVGGLMEKRVAARREGYARVLMPPGAVGQDVAAVATLQEAIGLAFA